ncbi:MAG: glycosyltransferase family 2 protein [Eubacterium sp.]|nr:glycosyltransferase family 2 protein [Eubacterium sp.]
MKKISLVIPCYNEEESLKYLYKELEKVAGEMPYFDFEYVFVDDGSKDKTLEHLKDLAAYDSKVTYLAFSRNFGKEAAMYAGLCNATGDYVAIMDADLQDPPSLLPEMVTYLESGEFDSVATRRVSRKGEPKIRSFFARRFYKLINRWSDADIADGARDFRLMTRDMVQAIVKMGERNRFSKGIFGWIGYRTKWIEYENVERVAGETKWSFWKLFKYSLEGIVNFTNAPLQIASVFGIIFTFIAFIAIIFIMIRKFIWGDPVSGWPSTICIIVFVSGVQMFCIGIIGQYLSKTYVEVKERPHYIISESNKEVEKVN